MIRLTAYISGSVQRVGYRAKVISLAEEMDLVGIVQNQPDGRVLVIAEGEKKDDLEKFASAIRIENAFIHVEDLSAKYSQGTGQYSTFRKVTGSNEVGERLDDGIEILKEIVIGLKNLTVMTKDLTTITKDGFENLTTTTKDGFENLGGKIDQTLEKQDQTISVLSGVDGKLDQMLDKQDATIGEIQGLRVDLKSYMDRKFKRIEADLAELKEMKAALKEKGLI